MNKEIALYVNNLGEITELNKAGFMKIFIKDKNIWNVVREIPFEFYTTQEEENIGVDALKISEVLEVCKVLVAKEIPDLLYMILDSIGVSIWKMEGEQHKILDYVLEKELEEAEEIKVINKLKIGDTKEGFFPMEIGSSGCYILNLKELQEHNIGITTKQVLKPFFSEDKFDELIINCDHIPCWLESELERLNLNFQTSKTGENDYILIINHNK